MIRVVAEGYVKLEDAAKETIATVVEPTYARHNLFAY